MADGQQRTLPTDENPASVDARIEAALEDLRAGRPVLVADSRARENEVDAVVSAQLASQEWIGWMIRHTSGYLCAPMSQERADMLGLPLMVPRTQDPKHTAYTLSVDAAIDTTTGISAHDRARTARVLADENSGPKDLIRPGHMLPLRAVAGGIGERGGHTEASVELCRQAGLAPVAVISELVHDDGSMMRYEDARLLAEQSNLVLVTIEEMLEHDRRINFDQRNSDGTDGADRVERIASAKLPTKHGDLTVIGYRDRRTDAEHVALVKESKDAAPLVRVHSECLTGDVLGSTKCDCGAQLNHALDLVGAQGGAVIYLRGHEGRGIGIAQKIAAYALQDAGADTVEANLALGWDPDLREYGAAAAILEDLGIGHVRLLTNNPKKVDALVEAGVHVDEAVPILVGVTGQNVDYLRTKAQRMGHTIDQSALAEMASDEVVDDAARTENN